MQREEVHILVVDDVSSMRVHLKTMLKELGFRKIDAASNGEEAKTMLDVSKYHLVLADWQMSPTNGLQLLEYIRNHPDHHEIPFVMVTAETTKEKVVQAVQTGVDGYLVKPLTPSEVQNKVYGVLLKRKII